MTGGCKEKPLPAVPIPYSNPTNLQYGYEIVYSFATTFYGAGSVEDLDNLSESFKRAIANFFSAIPESVYHAHDGVIEAYSERNLSYECACGYTHPVNDCEAIIDAGLSNIAVYGCCNGFAFTAVKPKGVFSIKGLKSLAGIACENEQQAGLVMMGLEARKKRG